MHKECQHTLLQKACFITAIGIHACSISILLLITPPKPPSVLSFFILLAGYTYARTSILLWNTGSITVNTNIKRSNIFQKYIITTGQKGTKSLTLRSSGMVPFSRWNPRSLSEVIWLKRCSWKNLQDRFPFCKVETPASVEEPTPESVQHKKVIKNIDRKPLYTVHWQNTRWRKVVKISIFCAVLA